MPSSSRSFKGHRGYDIKTQVDTLLLKVNAARIYSVSFDRGDQKVNFRKIST